MPTNPKQSPRNLSVMGAKGKTGPKPSFRKRAASAPVWDDIPASLVHSLICVCATNNSPATLSYTRDGTALVVAVYHEGDRYVDYLASQEEVVEYMEWLLTELLKLDEQEVSHYLQARL